MADMTAEETAFQMAVDAAPLDKLPRLVFCDWLDERNDPRAEGYRVLAVYDRWPWLLDTGGCFWSDYTSTETDRAMRPEYWHRNRSCDRSHLPDAWIAIVRPHHAVGSRREAMDTAAMAWGELTPAERTACLAELDRMTVHTGATG